MKVTGRAQAWRQRESMGCAGVIVKNPVDSGAIHLLDKSGSIFRLYQMIVGAIFYQENRARVVAIFRSQQRGSLDPVWSRAFILTRLQEPMKRNCRRYIQATAHTFDCGNPPKQ